jgi:hypothetical protein
MPDSIHILTTERDGDDGLIVTFSDGTTGAYVIEELLELRPFREWAKTKTGTNGHQNTGTVITQPQVITPPARAGRNDSRPRAI